MLYVAIYGPSYIYKRTLQMKKKNCQALLAEKKRYSFIATLNEYFCQKFREIVKILNIYFH